MSDLEFKAYLVSCVTSMKVKLDSLMGGTLARKDTSSDVDMEDQYHNSDVIVMTTLKAQLAMSEHKFYPTQQLTNFPSMGQVLRKPSNQVCFSQKYYQVKVLHSAHNKDFNIKDMNKATENWLRLACQRKGGKFFKKWTRKVSDTRRERPEEENSDS
ncbi:putative hemoglobin and hemoglobin-haptoglobin-binding protein 4 [Frankliniella fusca]|uniref:Hemoglobin and hemoglobin-haptoglobin-binding protein 4 n=1 Tax=Frankliniella fusca TaxID=407009 RepID=A0AAE1H8Y7_9NEOP|nr:putative hemoglobin and hemoglobin-haptoglobin-binding protein 4 [Frankliniella fusca]